MNQLFIYNSISSEELSRISGGQMSADTSFAYDVGYCVGYFVSLMVTLTRLGLVPYVSPL